MPRPTDDEIRARYGLPPGTRIVRLTPDDMGRVTVEPDAFAYVTVESALDTATWDRPVAVAGTTARLSVQGAMVGEDAPVAVALHDVRNRVVGRGEGRMFRDRVVVGVALDRRAAERDPDGVLCAADVEVKDLGLKVVSAPLLVLPYAELTRAEWGADRAAEGDVVALRCRIEGSRAGVERLSRERAEVAVLVRTEGGAAPLDEPVATFRTAVEDGRVEVEWAVSLGLDRWDLPSQAELDAEAARRGLPTGQPPYLYDRPHLVFRVRLAGLEAESGPLAVDDWVELALTNATGGGISDERYVLTLADGTTREGTLDAEGRAREDAVPPGSTRVEYPGAEE